MTGPIKRSAQIAKTGGCQNRQHKCRDGQQISAIGTVFRAFFRSRKQKGKEAHLLAELSKQPLDTCRKVLAGNRYHSQEMFEAMLWTSHGWDILSEMHRVRVEQGFEPVAWFLDRQRSLNAKAAKVALLKATRAIEAEEQAQLERELAQ